MARMRAAVAALLALGALAGCSKPDAAGSDGSSSAKVELGAGTHSASARAAGGSPGAPLTDLPSGDEPVSLARAATLVAPGGSRVELVDAGAEPLSALRLPTGEQAARRLELSVTVGLYITLPGRPAQKQPVPPMRVAMDLAVAPKTDGAANLTIALADVTLAPQSESEEAIAKKMRGVITQLRGLAWTMSYGAKGAKAVATPPKGTPTEVLQLWSTIDEALRDLLVPVPEKAIGVGARWRVFDRVRRAGVELLRRSDYTLAARDDKSLTLRASVSESAISTAAVRDPALPDGLTVRAASGSSRGKRELTRPLGSIVVQSSESTVVSRLTTLTRHELAAGESQRASLVLEQTLSMSARKDADGSTGIPAANARD
jgi:hypothetical protein